MSSRLALRIFVSTLSLLLLHGCNSDGSSSAPQTKVFKYSGSLQCQPNSGTDLSDHQAELLNAGVDVICAQTGHDGLSRITLCDADTGDINVFVIHSNNLEDAQNLGFAATSALPEYQDQACR